MRRVMADVKANLTIWRRSPSAVFFTVAFPLLLVVVFGSLFGGDGGPVTLAYQNNDASPPASLLLQGLSDSGAVKLVEIAPGLDARAVALDEDYHSTLIIPAGWGREFGQGGPARLTLISDPSRQSAATAAAVVRGVVQQLEQRASGQPARAVLIQESSRGDGAEAPAYIEFFLPGVIGLTIATNSLIGGLEIAAMLKQTGIMRKIATTPMRRWEWVLAKAVYQVCMASVTTVVVVLAGIFLYDVSVPLDWKWPLMIVIGGAGFAGLAMVLSRWVTKPDQANAAGSSVAFPMMFLSGTFFPLESMPTVLRGVAAALPLTYVTEGLRAAMITDDTGAFLFNGAIALAFAVTALGLGSVMVRWKEL